MRDPTHRTMAHRAPEAPGRCFSPERQALAKRPGVYISRRSSLRGYGYAKTSIVKWNRADQVLHGMRWGYYLLNGIRLGDISLVESHMHRKTPSRDIMKDCSGIFATHALAGHEAAGEPAPDAFMHRLMVPGLGAEPVRHAAFAAGAPGVQREGRRAAPHAHLVFSADSAHSQSPSVADSKRKYSSGHAASRMEWPLAQGAHPVREAKGNAPADADFREIPSPGPNQAACGLALDSPRARAIAGEAAANPHSADSGGFINRAAAPMMMRTASGENPGFQGAFGVRAAAEAATSAFIPHGRFTTPPPERWNSNKNARYCVDANPAIHESDGKNPFTPARGGFDRLPAAACAPHSGNEAPPGRNGHVDIPGIRRRAPKLMHACADALPPQ